MKREAFLGNTAFHTLAVNELSISFKLQTDYLLVSLVSSEKDSGNCLLYYIVPSYLYSRPKKGGNIFIHSTNIFQVPSWGLVLLLGSGEETAVKYGMILCSRCV